MISETNTSEEKKTAREQRQQEPVTISNAELRGLAISKTISGLFNGAVIGGALGIGLCILGIAGGAEPYLKDIFSVVAIPAGFGAGIGFFCGAASGFNKAKEIRQTALDVKLKAMKKQGPTTGL